jgi:hypothetical protein
LGCLQGRLPRVRPPTQGHVQLFAVERVVPGVAGGRLEYAVSVGAGTAAWLAQAGIAGALLAGGNPDAAKVLLVTFYRDAASGLADARKRIGYPLPSSPFACQDFCLIKSLATGLTTIAVKQGPELTRRGRRVTIRRSVASSRIMSTLINVHVLAGLAGIAAGLISVAGMFFRKPMAFWNAVFLSATAVACATGLVFLPTGGVTSAQLVAIFLALLLVLAAYARYVRHLNGSWSQVYAFTAVGALFLNVLITTAQSFLHVPLLQELAPTQHSPIYVAVKLSLLLLFIVVALVAAKRAGRS